MTTQSFITWLTDMFIPSPPEEHGPVLILDGHQSYVLLEVRQLAIENNISLLKLPSHLTHTLQPLDVSVVKSMKSRVISSLGPRLSNPLGKSLAS